MPQLWRIQRGQRQRRNPQLPDRRRPLHDTDLRYHPRGRIPTGWGRDGWRGLRRRLRRKLHLLRQHLPTV